MEHIYNFFSRCFTEPVNNQASCVDHDVIYDFLTDKQEYWRKCRPIINVMIETHLLLALSTVNIDNIEQFRSQFKLEEDQFNTFDIHHIDYCRPLIIKLLTDEYVDITEEFTRMMSKLISKRYILQPKVTNKKVSCEILVDDKKIKVNSYDMTKNHIHYFKNSKGSIEQDESVEDALLREMKEELNLEMPLSRYTLLQHVYNITNYQLILDNNEYKHYIKHLRTKDLDPEITHIVLTK
jgi:hypothetical protein